MIDTLLRFGNRKTVMLTGDSERTAAAVAAQVGVDDYRSEVLPEDKANYVAEQQAQGRVVVMLGDGINDSPALSAADVGIAISDGAALPGKSRISRSLRITWRNWLCCAEFPWR